MWFEAFSEGSIEAQLVGAIRNVVPFRNIAEELRRPCHCDQGEQVLLSLAKGRHSSSRSQILSSH